MPGSRLWLLIDWIRGKKREEVREGDDLPVILISGKLSSIYPSIPPSIPPSCCVPRAAYAAWGCWRDSLSSIWGILIGSQAYWVKAQKNPAHLLHLTPLYSKVILIPLSLSKMGLLGAICFSLALVSLTRLNITFYVKIYKTETVVWFFIVFIYRYFTLQKVRKWRHLRDYAGQKSYVLA